MSISRILMAASSCGVAAQAGHQANVMKFRQPAVLRPDRIRSLLAGFRDNFQRRKKLT
jgi:hypothetical protein